MALAGLGLPGGTSKLLPKNSVSSFSCLRKRADIGNQAHVALSGIPLLKISNVAGFLPD